MQNRMIDDVVNLLTPEHEKELEEGVKAILAEEKEKISEDKYAEIIKGAKKSINILLLNKGKADLAILSKSLDHVENPLKIAGCSSEDIERIRNRITNLEVGNKILAELREQILESSEEILARVMLLMLAQSPELALAFMYDNFNLDSLKEEDYDEVEIEIISTTSSVDQQKDSKETPVTPVSSHIEQPKIKSPSASLLSASMQKIIGAPASLEAAAVASVEVEQDKASEKRVSLG